LSKHLGTNIFSENDENLAANYYIVLYGMNFLFRAPGTINSTGSASLPSWGWSWRRQTGYGRKHPI